MEKTFVTIRSGNETETHLPDTSGNYATLCGMDGNDNDPTVDQETLLNKNNKVVTCRMCYHIWLVCQSYRKQDFIRAFTIV